MKKGLMFAATMLTVSLTLAACGESTIEQKDTTEISSEVQETKTIEKFAVGDTVVFDGTEVTLNELRTEAGGQFDTSSEGKFVVANITMKNTTAEEINISSLFGFELKDADGYSYNSTFLSEGTKGSLSGAIEPGGTLRGEIPFDVPDSDTYELHYSDLFKSGKAIWSISSTELN